MNSCASTRHLPPAVRAALAVGKRHLAVIAGDDPPIADGDSKDVGARYFNEPGRHRRPWSGPPNLDATPRDRLCSSRPARSRASRNLRERESTGHSQAQRNRARDGSHVPAVGTDAAARHDVVDVGVIIQTCGPRYAARRRNRRPWCRRTWGPLPGS